ncbi:hypothetical protein [Micromonospora sp. URMC 103]|uniref:hypothetical protein n=1 Tax=Micromonospora sp. URMC 103 TaxID=3423406 RepID=UPI003F1C01F0
MSPLHRYDAERGPLDDDVGRDDAYPLIRDERACVVTALRLGWWMADAYHHAQTADLVPTTGTRLRGAPAKLTNVTEMSGTQRMRMYLDAVETALIQIAGLTRTSGPVPTTAAARSRLPEASEPGRPAETSGTGRVRPPRADPGRARPLPAAAAEGLLLGLDDLNVDVLRWTMATNHRVGLAYRLGRSLADTVRQGDPDQLLRRFGGRQVQISRWLDELATVLPPYSAVVVRRSLADWAAAVSRAYVGDPAEAGLADLARELRNQGDLWRGVLTGGLHPRDLLDEEDYAVVARNLIIRDRRLVAQAARGIFWPVLLPLLAVLFVVVGVSAVAAGGSPTTRAAVALLGLGAGLAAVWRSIAGPALAVAGEVNRPLLESELAVRMAVRLSRPLSAARATATVAGRVGGRARRQRRPADPDPRSNSVARLSPADLP